MKENRVDLCHEAESSIGNILVAEDSNTKTENDEEVMNKELPGAFLPVVEQHVKAVIDEVADGERDKTVAERGEAVDQVIMHLWGLVEGNRSSNT